ncbi:hypothetical protein K474DRAFT_1710503 [Panus rudis PR-1116 ss-1]|nr:hypothetical protein K474DRAFT_1710503 [Panus rudis PR-1116 ss-1]
MPYDPVAYNTSEIAILELPDLVDQIEHTELQKAGLHLEMSQLQQHLYTILLPQNRGDRSDKEVAAEHAQISLVLDDRKLAYREIEARNARYKKDFAAFVGVRSFDDLQLDPCHLSKNLEGPLKQRLRWQKAQFLAYPHPKYPFEPRFALGEDPVLSREAFDRSYGDFISRVDPPRDDRLLAVSGRWIDLYGLHCVVKREGGYPTIMQGSSEDDRWSFIAAQPDTFHNTTTSEVVPPSPEVASQVHQVYCVYLRHYDYECFVKRGGVGSHPSY